jgi:Tfp pilus assembly protein PilF
MIYRCGYALGLIGLLTLGCAPSKDGPATDYQTVPDRPGRRTDLATQRVNQALGYIQEGRWDQAEKRLRQAIEADIMFGPAHNNLGKVHYHQQRYYEAAWEFEYAAKLMPHRPEPRNNLGLVFEAVGRTDSAVEAYTRALELEPENPQLLGNLARARVRRGDRDESMRQLLSKLILNDTRSEWVQWARRQRALMSHVDD